MDTCGECFLEPRVASLPLAECPECRTEVVLGYCPLTRYPLMRPLLQSRPIGSERLLESRRAVFPLAKDSERGTKVVLSLRPRQGRQLARPLLQRRAVGGDCLFQPCRPGLPLAQRPERVAEVVLRRRTVKGPFGARSESEAPVISIDCFDQGVVIAEFVALFVEFACLTEQETPLLLRVGRHNNRGGFGIFRGRGPIGELEAVDARSLS